MSADNVIFRQARREDLEKIVSILADDELGQTREDPSLPLAAEYLSAFKAIDTDAKQLLAVIEIDGEVAGTLQLTCLPGLSRFGSWRGQIEAVRIARDHRGGGLGHRVFAWAIDQCRKRGCRLVQLTTDKSRPDAFRFYEQLGFTASHEGFKLQLED